MHEGQHLVVGGINPHGAGRHLVRPDSRVGPAHPAPALPDDEPVVAWDLAEEWDEEPATAEDAP